MYYPSPLAAQAICAAPCLGVFCVATQMLDTFQWSSIELEVQEVQEVMFDMINQGSDAGDEWNSDAYVTLSIY